MTKLKFLTEEEKQSEKQYLYRVWDVTDGSYFTDKYKIIKETQCGWWILYGWSEKFVYKTGKNNFAKATKEEALNAYYHRKKAHLRHLENRARKVRNIIKRLETERQGTEGERDDAEFAAAMGWNR